ncbi:hypothetical protein ISN44_As06g036010 [Arabidopsis suecica]|uniref:Uncharacterized protein n=1 Tax=Arabidopsis suecica TaxID=45249 RepID=A0A8T2CGB6_ARASU|nr:hypothetical protein ISN44_As06g036010 [Arabidopsis suecica]
MSSYMNSMLKLILEEQERGIVWSPTSYQGAYEPSTSREYQPNGNYAQGNQCGYGERFQSSEMNCYYGALYSSPISNEEENYNLLKLILEEQEKYNESLRMIDTEIGAWTPGSRVFEATHVEPINNNLTRWIEEQEEECIPLSETKTKEVLPNDIGEVFEENAQIKDEFLREAKESIREFELLLEYTVDENLVVRYKEQVEPVAILSYSTKSNEKRLGVVGITFEDPCEGVLVFEYMVRKHLGTISTNEVSIDEVSIVEVSIDEPRKILFEEIRMKKFRGWYYDEYDPGDTWIHLTLFHRFLKLLSLLEVHGVDFRVLMAIGALMGVKRSKSSKEELEEYEEMEKKMHQTPSYSVDTSAVCISLCTLLRANFLYYPNSKTGSDPPVMGRPGPF